MVSSLRQQSSVGWDLQNFGREPTLAEKLYVLLLLVSIAIAVVQLVRNWTLLPPFRRLPFESSRRAALVFHRHALSLQRWMILNVLAWGAGTVTGLVELFRGTWASRMVGMQFVTGGLEEVLRPSELFFLTLIVLYLVRWHILWRAERLKRCESPGPGV